MKTKLQILAAFVALSSVVVANYHSSTVAILGNENGIISVPVTANGLNFVTPSQGSLLTNATILKDGTVISKEKAKNNTIAVADNTDATENMASYHHGSGGGDGGDGIAGKNIVIAGVGFVSLVGIFASALSFATSTYTAAGGTNAPTISSIPAIDIGYERGLSQHWGLGLRFSYQSVSATSNGSYTYDGSQGPNGTVGTTYTITDKASITGLSFMATGAYHFSASDRVDPYIGLAFGYTSLSLSYSSTGDPNASTDGNSTAPVFGIGGVSFGGDVGVRLFFTNNIGAWVDLGYWGYGGAIFNLGLAAKF